MTKPRRIPKGPMSFKIAWLLGRLAYKINRGPIEELVALRMLQQRFGSSEDTGLFADASMRRTWDNPSDAIFDPSTRYVRVTPVDRPFHPSEPHLSNARNRVTEEEAETFHRLHYSHLSNGTPNRPALESIGRRSSPPTADGTLGRC